MSRIFGNFISSTILKPEENESATSTLNMNCGATDCPASDSESESSQMSLKKPQMSTVYMLCTVYVSLGVLSIVLIKFGLREYARSESVTTTSINQRFDLLISTITQMKEKYQLLIIPITLWMGFSLAFIGADFTKSFVACSKGIIHILYYLYWIY